MRSFLAALKFCIAGSTNSQDRRRRIVADSQDRRRRIVADSQDRRRRIVAEITQTQGTRRKTRVKPTLGSRCFSSSPPPHLSTKLV